VPLRRRDIEGVSRLAIEWREESGKEETNDLIFFSYGN
jgi:hypothetical protein